jgi:hypothetical protein
MLEKKVTSASAEPIRIAEQAEIRTPFLPAPAWWGLAECEPIAHTVAAIAIPATQAIRP